MTEVEIPSLDGFLSGIMEGLPVMAEKRYELRCHPDVYLALRDATPDPGYPSPMRPLYGTADVVVRPDLGSGGWELYEDGSLLKSGRLGEAPESR